MKRLFAVFGWICAPALAQLSPAPIAELNAWHEHVVELCANDSDCLRVAKKTYDDALLCIGGDAVACDRRGDNVREIDRWNAGHFRLPPQRQGETAEQWWARWKAQSLDFCSANLRCSAVVNRLYDHYRQCEAGDPVACSARVRDEADWGVETGTSRNPFVAAPDLQKSAQQGLMECLQETAAPIVRECKAAVCDPQRLSSTVAWAQKAHCGYTAVRGQAPLPVPPAPLMACLRETAANSTAACRRAGCTPEAIFFVISGVQKVRCGYTALQPADTSVAPAPGAVLANCYTTPNAAGEWVTACTRF